MWDLLLNIYNPYKWVMYLGFSENRNFYKGEIHTFFSWKDCTYTTGCTVKSEESGAHVWCSVSFLKTY